MLLDDSTLKFEQRRFAAVGAADVPYYDIFGHKVWGATAMILAEFSAIIEQIDLRIEL